MGSQSKGSAWNVEEQSALPAENDRRVGRRLFAKGLAWSAPVVLSVTAAPAFASSTIPPRLYISGKTFFNRPYGGSGVDDEERLVIYTTTPGMGLTIPAPVDRGLSVQPTTPETTIADARVTFWFASPDLRFERGPGHDAGWSLLSRDNSTATKVNPNNRLTYYPYTTYYSNPIVALPGRTLLPSFAFNTPGSARGLLKDMEYFNSNQMWVSLSASATVDGARQDRTYGFLGMPRG